MEHYYQTNKFLPKHQKRQLSLENSHIIPVLNSLCRIKKISQIPSSIMEKTSEPKLLDKLIKTPKNKNSTNFSVLDGKIVLKTEKAELLHEYLQFPRGKNQVNIPPNLSTLVNKYLAIFQKQNPKIKKCDSGNFVNKNGLSIDKTDITYRFAPSFNQFYLDTRSKYYKFCSCLKNKSVLRNSFNNSKFKKLENEHQKKENFKKLNNLLFIKKGKLNEKSLMFCSGDIEIKKSGNNVNSMNVQISKKKIQSTSKKKLEEEYKLAQKRSQSKDFVNKPLVNYDKKLMMALNINESFNLDGDKDEDLEYYLRNNYFNNNTKNF